MTQFLPANLLALFSARPPIPFKPPVEGLKKRKNSHCYVGLGDFVSNFEVFTVFIVCIVTIVDLIHNLVYFSNLFSAF